MKVWELMEKLSNARAGDDVVCFLGEKEVKIAHVDMMDDDCDYININLAKA